MLRRCALLVTASIVSVLLFSGCETDSGSSGVTKKALCGRLTGALCDRAGQVGCPGTTSECKTASQSDCASSFADDCVATADMIEKIDHDITMIIQPKETCDALESVLDYLNGTLSDLAASPCQSAGPSSSNQSLGSACETLVAQVCTKIIDLGCAAMTLSDCELSLFQGGAVTIGSYACTSTTDTTPATDAQVTEFQGSMTAVTNASTCAEFGF